MRRIAHARSSTLRLFLAHFGLPAAAANCGLLIILSVLLATTVSCRKSGMTQEGVNTDLHAFIVTQIKNYGGIDKTASLPTPRAPIPYRYTQEKDGFQVFCQGDRVADIVAMLRVSYGPPAIARTNNLGNPSFTYSIRQIGVALECGIDVAERGRAGETKFTHLVIVKASALP